MSNLKKQSIIIIIYILITFILFFVHLSIGYIDLDLSALFTLDLSPLNHDVIFDIRLPRTIAAFLTGSSLALSGVLLQGIFRNPLAAPGIIGTSAGSMLGVSILVSLGIQTWSIICLGSFFLAFLNSMIVYFISYQFSERKSNIITMILAGVAINALSAGISNFLLTINIDEWELGKQLLFFSFGGFENAIWFDLTYCAPIIFICFIFSLFFIKPMNLLTLNEENAHALGLNIEINRVVILFVCSVLTGLSVILGGMIAFVGLICPHIVRLFTGNKHQLLLPHTFMVGGLFLLLADIIVKKVELLYRVDLRIGILTSLLGFPFFIFLIIKGKK